MTRGDLIQRIEQYGETAVRNFEIETIRASALLVNQELQVLWDAKRAAEAAADEAKKTYEAMVDQLYPRKIEPYGYLRSRADKTPRDLAFTDLKKQVNYEDKIRELKTKFDSAAAKARRLKNPKALLGFANLLGVPVDGGEVSGPDTLIPKDVDVTYLRPIIASVTDNLALPAPEQEEADG